MSSQFKFAIQRNVVADVVSVVVVVVDVVVVVVVVVVDVDVDVVVVVGIDCRDISICRKNSGQECFRSKLQRKQENTVFVCFS